MEEERIFAIEVREREPLRVTCITGGGVVVPCASLAEWETG